MHVHRFLILAAALFVVLSAAGCTSQSSSLTSATMPAATPSGSASSGVALSLLALTPADLPAGYEETAARAKESSEVSETAQNLGWQAGYVVTFANRSAPAGQQDTIIQTLTTYPEASMAGIIGIMNMQEKSFSGMTYSDIPVSGIGTSGTGFVARISTNTTEQPTSTSALPNMAGAEGRKYAGPGQDFAEVYFTKGTTIEVIRMTGPHASGEEVATLAQTAYKRIP